MLRRLLCLILVICFLLLIGVHSYAVSETVLVAAILAACAAMGITFTFVGLDAAGVQSSIIGQLQTWGSNGGVSLEDMLDMPVTLVNGLISLNPMLAHAVTDFAQWLREHFSLVDSSSVIVSEGVIDSIPNTDGYTLPCGNGTNGLRYSWKSILPLVAGAVVDIHCTTGNVIRIDYDARTLNILGPDGSVLLPGRTGPINADYWGLFTYDGYVRSWYYNNSGGGSGWNIWTSNEGTNSNLFRQYTGLGGTYSTGIDTGVIDIPDTTGTESIYVGPDVINPSGTIDGIADAVIDAAVEGDLTASLDVTDETPDPDAPLPSSPPIGSPDGYQVPGFDQVFPFCIPFDMLEAVRLLNAEPEAPSVSVDLVVPSLNFRYELQYDLSEFDAAAAAFRKMELLLFVVGLAVVTRSLYIRG